MPSRAGIGSGEVRRVDVFEAINTTRAMRRLNNSRAVADEDIRKILEAGTRAATGGNSQPVRWVVVTDPEVKRRLGGVYRRTASQLLEGDQDSPPTRSSWHLAAPFGDAPALRLVCTDGPN